MRPHLSNAAYGVLDYAAYPVGMLLVAPILLRHLGVAQYGVWTVATAAVSAGSILASGFGDANIQHVASMRSVGNHDALLHAVRGTMGINLILGALLAAISWIVVPFVVHHIVPSGSDLRNACLWSLRIAALLMLVRAVESVCISTQRAFDRYGAAVRISILCRLLALVAAVALTRRGHGVISVMLATALLMILGTAGQLMRLKQHLGGASLLPAFDRDAMTALFGFGVFSWLQAVSGVLFGQGDRLILGYALGATAVTSYALCVQMAQPIYGVVASGLHFLFPYLAARQAIEPTAALKKAVLIAFAVNVTLVFAGTGILLLFGRRVLHVWVGEAVAQSSAALLTPILWSSALLGLNVTGTYALLALGKVRIVTWLNLAGGATMLILMIWLLPRTGVQGVATARISYGLVTLLMYYPLVRLLRNSSRRSLQSSADAPVCESA